MFVCIENTLDRDLSIDLYDTVKKLLRLSDGQLFLFRVSDDCTGSFYCGSDCFVLMDNIYGAYETCYMFSARNLES